LDAIACGLINCLVPIKLLIPFKLLVLLRLSCSPLSLLFVLTLFGPLLPLAGSPLIPIIPVFGLCMELLL